MSEQVLAGPLPNQLDFFWLHVVVQPSLAGDPLNVCPSALHSCDCSAGIMKWPAGIDGLVTLREGQPGGGTGWTALLWSQTQAVQAGLQIEL